MTTKVSKTLPFIVLAIIIGAFVYEGYTGNTIDLEAYVPILVAIGIGGAGKDAIIKASQARKQIPKEIQTQIRDEVKKVIQKGTG